MVITMKLGVTKKQIEQIIAGVKKQKLTPKVIYGAERTVIAVIGVIDLKREQLIEHFSAFDGVEKVTPISKPYKLVSRKGDVGKIIKISKDIEIGNGNFVVIAGPCAVESKRQLRIAAEAIKGAGGQILRGCPWKPRTYPGGFQGLGPKGLRILEEIGEEFSLPTACEVMEDKHVSLAIKHKVSLPWVGARNAQVFPFLKRLGKLRRPIMVKNPLAGTTDEFLGAAEYILHGGNQEVVLCYRGIKSTEPHTRFAFDAGVISYLKQETWLPVFADPSHAAGDWRLVSDIAKSAVAAGADGLIIEVHPDPKKARSDANQQLNPDQFVKLMKEIKRLVQTVGKKM